MLVPWRKKVSSFCGKCFHFLGMSGRWSQTILKEKLLAGNYRTLCWTLGLAIQIQICCQVITGMFCRRKEPPPRWNVPPRISPHCLCYEAFPKEFKYCSNFKFLSRSCPSPQDVLIEFPRSVTCAHSSVLRSCPVHGSSLHISFRSLKILSLDWEFEWQQSLITRPLLLCIPLPSLGMRTPSLVPPGALPPPSPWPSYHPTC